MAGERAGRSEPAGEEVFERIAFHAGLPYLTLDGDPDPSSAAARRVFPAALARGFGVVPVRLEGDVLVLASPTPGAEEARAAAAGLGGLRTQLAIASPAAIARAQEQLYGPHVVEAPEGVTGLVPDPEEGGRFRTLARHAGLAYLEPGAVPPLDPEVVRLLPAALCRRLGVLPLAASAEEVVLATSTPFDAVALEGVRLLVDRRLRLVVAAPSTIEQALARRRPDAAVPAELTQSERGAALGELLVEAGLVTTGQVEEALRVQRRVGGRLGELLVHAGAVGETAVVSQVARQFGLPLADLQHARPDPQALALIPEPVARRLGLVPLRIDRHVLEVASSDRLSAATLAEVRNHTQLPIRVVLATPTGIRELLQRTYAARYVRVATTELLNRSPDESSFRVLSSAQKVVFSVALAVFVAFLFYDPIATVIVFNIASIVFYTSLLGLQVAS